MLWGSGVGVPHGFDCTVMECNLVYLTLVGGFLAGTLLPGGLRLPPWASCWYICINTCGMYRHVRGCQYLLLLLKIGFGAEVEQKARAKATL